ncbi:MAG: hypothetical protein IJV26_09965 [Lachnospiraceae bacterium]|nr:hypothetical protein [Lachnospiraceae bacterium]
MKNRYYAVLFLAMLIVLGLGSTAKLTDHYLNNTPLNHVYEPQAGEGRLLDTDFTASFAGSRFFINLNGLMRRAAGQREMNEVVKLDNGYLAGTMEDLDDWLLEQNADKTAYAAHRLKEMGVPFLYVATPETIAPQDSNVFTQDGVLPAGLEDYGNINMDVFVQRLSGSDAEVMDLRALMREDGIDPYSLMYRTDHHWTTEGGFYAFTKIAEWVEKKTGKRVDPALLSLDSYQKEVYPAWHLGSRGQRTGRWFAGADDFVLYLPREDVEVVNHRTGETGPFSEQVISRAPLAQRDPDSMYTYDRVLEKSLGQFTNPSADNDARIMILCDSMGEAVCPFLILGYRDVYYLDSYYPGNLTQSLVEEWKPDAVILLQYPGLLKNDYSYEFSF